MMYGRRYLPEICSAEINRSKSNITMNLWDIYCHIIRIYFGGDIGFYIFDKNESFNSVVEIYSICLHYGALFCCLAIQFCERVIIQIYDSGCWQDIELLLQKKRMI